MAEGSHSRLERALGYLWDGRVVRGDGSIWLATTARVYQIDPRTLATRRTIASPIAISSIWFGDAAAWISSETPGGGVGRIDPVTAQITASPGTDAIQITFTTRRVWLAAAAGATALAPTTGHLIGTIPASDVPDESSAGIAIVRNQLWVAYTDQELLEILNISRT